jgi:hypothetical protein
MILQPAALALIVAALLTGFMVLYAGWYGLLILLRWDMRSGSELQLSLERRTYLISAIVNFALVCQLLSLLLFIYTADDLHSLFTGAMCAAGTLHVNGYGYPVLALKIVNFLLAGLWLIINYADTRGYDYPLIRVKYGLLLAMVPLMLLESFFLIAYFAGLHADVITSCCGSLFSLDRPGIGGDLAGLPGRATAIAFYCSIGATAACGITFLGKGRAGYLFAALSSTSFIIAIAALVSFFSLYFYELPTHHCPFCILQSHYGFVGYLLYGCLLGGAVAGLGVSALMPLRSRGSMAAVIPPLQRRLTAAALVLYGIFSLVVTWHVLFCSFRII